MCTRPVESTKLISSLVTPLQMRSPQHRWEFRIVRMSSPEQPIFQMFKASLKDGTFADMYNF